LEADLIEEVARIHGLDQVPAATPQARINPEMDDARSRAVAECRHALTGLGLSEIVNYSFLSEATLNAFTPAELARRVALPNPVSADYAVMRDALVPQMVETLGRNLSHQNADAALFEIGRVFLRNASGDTTEEERLCIGLMGKTGRAALDRRRAVEPDEMFLWIKGVVESLCDAQRAGAVSVTRAEHPCLEPGWTVSVLVAGRSVGMLGLVRAPIRKQWRIADPVGIAELQLDPLLARARETPSVRPLATYPSVTRDVALVVDQGVTHADALKTIWKSAPKELTRVDLFDIFTAKEMGDRKRSLAYSLVYRSFERSLTDDEANRFRECACEALRRELNAQIRDS
jgi:phenylalanyl-tRNA synthetase beta chain